jgi:hypothetical protein
LTAIQSAIAAAPAPPTMSMTRAGRDYEVQFRLLPIELSAQAITLARAEAITTLQGLLGARGGSTDAAVDLTNRFVEASGEILPNSSELYGFPFNMSDQPPVKGYSMALGLQLGDWIKSIDGRPITDIDEFISYVQGIVDRLRATQDAVVIALEIERGEFQRVDLTITIN